MLGGNKHRMRFEITIDSVPLLYAAVVIPLLEGRAFVNQVLSLTDCIMMLVMWGIFCFVLFFPREDAGHFQRMTTQISGIVLKTKNTAY